MITNVQARHALQQLENDLPRLEALEPGFERAFALDAALEDVREVLRATTLSRTTRVRGWAVKDRLVALAQASN